MSLRPDRRGSVPRSVPVLLLVAVLAVGGLWLSGRRQATDFTRGGPLFPVAPDQIEGLLLTRQGLQYRFDRQPDQRWSLSGPISDYLDTGAMRALVESLAGAQGGAVLPGTEAEDRRYEFNGPDAIRLRVFRSDGADFLLSLGTANPVTDTYYASGVGREGCFPVPASLRARLAMLPATVQAKTLLPAFDRDRLQELRLVRSGTEHRFARHDGKWWLLWPAGPESDAWRGLPPLVQQYQASYDDRRREDADGRWVMAADLAIGQLVHEVSETVVREVLGPRESAARVGQWELDPPWREVVLQGTGLNPDPGAPNPDRLAIAFGPPVGADRVPALRRGNVLLTDLLSVTLLDQGLDVLIEQGPLNDNALQADRLRLEREGQVLVEAGRTGTADSEEGRSAWLTTVPGPGEGTWSESDRHGLGQDLVVNLNRIKVLAVLPPTLDAGVLEGRERVRIRLEWDGSGGQRELVLESGYLAPDHLPAAASQLLARTPDGGPAVGLWFPASGKLLQIPNQLVVTARSISTP